MKRDKTWVTKKMFRQSGENSKDYLPFQSAFKLSIMHCFMFAWRQYDTCSIAALQQTHCYSCQATARPHVSTLTFATPLHSEVKISTLPRIVFPSFHYLTYLATTSLAQALCTIIYNNKSRTGMGVDRSGHGQLWIIIRTFTWINGETRCKAHMTK